MASTPEDNSQETFDHCCNEKDEKPADEVTSPTTNELQPQDTSTSSIAAGHEISYPEGGLQAWLVVFGAFCATAASIGVYNTSGVFETYMSEILLHDESTSKVGWIFGVYAFVTWFLGVQVGPLFDARGPTLLLLVGSVCTLGGVFALSACTEYYQIILSFSLLIGTGTSLLFSPAVASVAHYFHSRRGLATGIAWIGSGIGGVIFPLMLQSLLPQIGWAWSIRAFGLILLVLCGLSIALCRSRLPPRRGSATTWRDAMPSLRIFRDETGAMALTTVGVVLTDLAYFIPVTYIPSYYIARQRLPDRALLSGEASFAFQLLAISNASSCFGRGTAGWASDRLGRYNTMIVSLFLCAVSVLCFWLPDILLADLQNIGLLLTFVILFGFVSGSNVSLLPVCMGQLCEIHEFGRYYATCVSGIAFGALISIPSAGGLLDAVGETGKRRYWGVAVFTGLCYVVAMACFAAVRLRVVGWGWRTRW